MFLCLPILMVAESDECCITSPVYSQKEGLFLEKNRKVAKDNNQFIKSSIQFVPIKLSVHR